MDLSPYRALFVSEARCHISAFSEVILRSVDSLSDSTAIDELFRHAHSLKGMAATMGYEQVVEIAHRLEDQLCRIRSEESQLQPNSADLLLEGCDTLTHMVSGIEAESPVL